MTAWIGRGIRGSPSRAFASPYKRRGATVPAQDGESERAMRTASPRPSAPSIRTRTLPRSSRSTFSATSSSRSVTAALIGVEEEVRRPGDPDGALAVELQAHDSRRVADHLAHVLGEQVATELADQQADPGRPGRRQPGRGRIDQRQLAAGDRAADEGPVGLAERARDQGLEGERGGRVLERHRLAELQRALGRRRRRELGALDGRPRESEDVAHRVAHGLGGGVCGRGGAQQDEGHERQRPAAGRATAATGPRLGTVGRSASSRRRTLRSSAGVGG